MKLKDQIKNSNISFWIDSSGGPEDYSKNSFYGTDPKYYFYGSLNEVTLIDCDSGVVTYDSVNCFDFLNEKLQEEKDNKNGVFVGYFSYDLSDFFFAYFENSAPVATLHATSLQGATSLRGNNVLQSNMSDAEYLNKVLQIKEEIKKGNVYQVNLTREYLVELGELDELDLYLRLRKESPNPYGCYFKTPFMSILSSSPEEFIYVKDRFIRTRPIKGTLSANDNFIDAKNKAENIMIVDLERNDLGKICDFGSIKVDNLLSIEKYTNLNHVVSTISGKLKENITLREIFEALFPGGSITGAPKIAAMKIIEKIEPSKRKIYTGSFGYIKTDGTMNFNILIRTMFIRHTQNNEHIGQQDYRTTGQLDGMDTRNIQTIPKSSSPVILTFNIGGGIVADSDPESELNEINLKAKSIIKTLGIKTC